MDNNLTLSQLMENYSDYLTNNTTTLICSPGNYNLESELVVENVHSFSMFVQPGSSSKAVITCSHNARFEFRNVSAVTVSGLEFIGCFENYVISVGQFQLENSGFFGSGQTIGNRTVLNIEESVANLNRFTFVSVVDKQELSYNYHSNCSVLDQTISAMDLDRVIGISSRSSNISITHSWFEGNNVGLIGAVLYDEFDSDVMITNTTFINNSANDLYTRYACHCFSDCNNITSGIVHTSCHGNTYDSKFVQNEGIVILGENCTMLITHTMFMNNVYSGSSVVTVGVTDSNLVISHSTFTNNTGYVLYIRNTNVNFSHSEFISNQYGYLCTVECMVISIDHSKFINNTEWILTARWPNCKCDATCSAILPCMHTVHILVVTPAQARLDCWGQG